MQATAIMKSAQPHFTMRHVSVQMQSGASDCGLFAIAFATLLCGRNNTGEYSLPKESTPQNVLRKMVNFPTSGRRRRCATTIISTKTVDVYCYCQLPWTKDFAKYGDLAQCQSCRMWYHHKCAAIPQEAFTSKHFIWKCMSCLH